MLTFSIECTVLSMDPIAGGAQKAFKSARARRAMVSTSSGNEGEALAAFWGLKLRASTSNGDLTQGRSRDSELQGNQADTCASGLASKDNEECCTSKIGSVRKWELEDRQLLWAAGSGWDAGGGRERRKMVAVSKAVGDFLLEGWFPQTDDMPTVRRKLR